MAIEPGVGDDDHIGLLDAALVEEIGAHHLNIEAAGDPLLPFDLRTRFAERGREARQRRLKRGSEIQRRVGEPLDARRCDDENPDAALDIEHEDH